MQGMAFGAGSEIAHRAIGGMMGGHGGHGAQPAQQPQQSADQGGYDQGQYGAQPQPCMNEQNDFTSCLMNNATNIGYCQNFLELFKNCQSNLGAQNY